MPFYATPYFYGYVSKKAHMTLSGNQYTLDQKAKF